jgi:hypothetical protein
MEGDSYRSRQRPGQAPQPPPPRRRSGANRSRNRILTPAR